MQTENLQCYHCGNVMLVDRDLLDQPVTCSKCLQTIESKYDAGHPAGEAKEFASPFGQASEEQESIFGSAEPQLDALFGDEEVLQVQMPSEPKAPSLVEVGQSETILPFSAGAANEIKRETAPLAESNSKAIASSSIEPVSPELQDRPLSASSGFHPADGAPMPSAQNEEERLLKFTGQQPPFADLADLTNPESTGLGSSGVALAPAFSVGSSPSPSSDALAGPDFAVIQHGNTSQHADMHNEDRPDSGTSLRNREFLASLPRRATPREMRSGLFLAVVVLPLISYSILATIAVIILYLRPAQPSLEYLPDLEGDLKGVKSQKKTSMSYERLSPDSDLPERLWVALGGTIRLGDVEVTPKKVELRPIQIRHAGADAETEAADKQSLVLHIEYKNVSDDLVFSPTDPYFDRRWKPSQPAKPYNFVDLDGKKLYGGALAWSAGHSLEKRDAVVGQTYRYLEPGQISSTIVCTDPEDEAGGLIEAQKGLIRWRVQLRRGPVRLDGRSISTTGVIGVKFSKEQITRPAS
jgi:hypothetical protein